jgi:hypothetical protein
MPVPSGTGGREGTATIDLLVATSVPTSGRQRQRTSTRLAIRAFRDARRQLQDARAASDAGLADQLVNWSRASLLHAYSGRGSRATPLLGGQWWCGRMERGVPAPAGG